MSKVKAQTGSLPEPHVTSVGEHGMLFTFTPQEEQQLSLPAPLQLSLPAPLQVQQRIWALDSWLKEHRQELSLAEIVPGMGNLLLVLHPAATQHTELIARLLSLWPTLAPLPGSGRTVEIP